MKLSKQQREEIRMKFGGRCAYCGCELPANGWHVDHVAPIYRESEIDRKRHAQGEFKLVQTGRCERPENENPDNYWPACAPCNRFKGVYDIETWRGELAMQVERARKESFNFKFAERFGLVQATGKPVVFWFEQYAATK
jgi:5-methylcytosine-specific restriction endonuclease McrA